MYLSIHTYFIFSYKIFFFSCPLKCFKNFNRDLCFKRESFLYREYLLKDHVQVSVLYLISANCLNHNKKVIQSIQQCFEIKWNDLSPHLDLPCTNCNVIFNRVQARGSFPIPRDSYTKMNNVYHHLCKEIKCFCFKL